jgi:endonuclease YncB( thermonuclease family)
MQSDEDETRPTERGQCAVKAARTVPTGGIGRRTRRHRALFLPTYRRLLSTIFIDGKDINLAMIGAGLAEVYRGPESGNPYKPKYQAAEETARTTKKGMWLLGDQYESPRAYRKRVGIS